MKIILVDARNTFITQEGFSQPMKALLDNFKNRKIIVTNADASEKITLWMVDLPYELFSLSHQPDKTDPSYFLTLCQELNVQPWDLIYFEHNPQAVNAAQSLGIPSWHYDKDTKDLVWLKAFLSEHL